MACRCASRSVAASGTTAMPSMKETKPQGNPFTRGRELPTVQQCRIRILPRRRGILDFSLGTSSRFRFGGVLLRSASDRANLRWDDGVNYNNGSKSRVGFRSCTHIELLWHKNRSARTHVSRFAFNIYAQTVQDYPSWLPSLDRSRTKLYPLPPTAVGTNTLPKRKSRLIR